MPSLKGGILRTNAGSIGSLVPDGEVVAIAQEGRWQYGQWTSGQCGVMATYNRAGTVSKAIDSVLKQSYQRLEVL